MPSEQVRRNGTKSSSPKTPSRKSKVGNKTLNQQDPEENANWGAPKVGPRHPAEDGERLGVLLLNAALEEQRSLLLKERGYTDSKGEWVKCVTLTRIRVRIMR